VGGWGGGQNVVALKKSASYVACKLLNSLCSVGRGEVGSACTLLRATSLKFHYMWQNKYSAACVFEGETALFLGWYAGRKWGIKS
jgi:hypothetical protein